MSSQGFLLASTQWSVVRERRYEVAVLPWGATEAHNYHLPYGTDIFESEYIAAESARKASEAGAKVVVLPTVPFGVNTGQMDIPMTINMNPSTQAALLRDVADSLVRHGIPKLLILNSHGGNEFKPMVRELQLQVPQLFICTINWWQILPQTDFFENPDDHAGEMETSIMLAIRPESVLPLTVAGSGKSKSFSITALREKWAWAPRDWTKTTDDTGVGDPSKATKEKGRRFLDEVTRKIGEFLTELAQADPGSLYR